jgi:Family of unknown function (DUF6299)
MGMIATYTGSRGALTEGGCVGGGGGVVAVRANETYFFMLGQTFASVTFRIEEAAPPPTLALQVDRFGSVNSRTGVATIGGTLTCTGAVGDVTISADVQQLFAKRVTIFGGGSATSACSDTRWTMTVVGSNGRLAPGAATVHIYAFASNSIGESVQVDLNASISLKGSK